MFNVISITFQDTFKDGNYRPREYSYLTDLSSLEVGDFLVVDTQYGYRVAKVSSLFGDEGAANKWVVCRVDISAFEAKLNELKRKQFVRKQVKQRVAQASFIDQARLLAKSDPILEKLLASLETLELIASADK